MALYDFRCTVCGLAFEVSRPMAQAAEPAHCPVDGAESPALLHHAQDRLEAGRRPTCRAPLPGPGDRSLSVHGAALPGSTSSPPSG